MWCAERCPSNLLFGEDAKEVEKERHIIAAKTSRELSRHCTQHGSNTQTSLKLFLTGGA